MKIINLSWNPEARALVTGKGGCGDPGRAPLIVLQFRDEAVVRLTLYAASPPSPISLPPDLAWRVRAFAEGNPTAVSGCDDADFNLDGDWETDEAADPDVGQLSFRLSGNYPELAEAIGTKTTVRGSLEVTGFNVFGVIVQSVTLPILFLQRLDDGEIELPGRLGEDRGFMLVTGGDGITRTAHLFPDGQWRVFVPLIEDGSPTHTWEIINIEGES